MRGLAQVTRKPSALIVDFGGVMTTNLFDSMRGFATREGLPDESVVNLLTKNQEGAGILASLERGDISQLDFETAIGMLLGVSSRDLVRRILADLKPDNAMLDTIDKIRTSGNKVVVLSNTWGLEPYDPYESYDLDARADAVLYSELVRLRKPDPAIFRIAVERAAVAPTSCVFVDDIVHNLDPARNMGMRTIHHTNSAVTVKLLTEAFNLGGVKWS